MFDGESGTATTDDKNEERSRKLREEWDEFVRTHKNATEEQLHAFKREVEETLQRMGDEDKRERERLAADLKEIKDAMAEERKARDEKAKNEGGSGTLVVPPSEIAPTSGTANKPTDTTADGGAPKRRGWKGWI